MKLDELEELLVLLRRNGVTKYSGTPDGYTGLVVELAPYPGEERKTEAKKSPGRTGADGLSAEMQRLAYGDTFDAVEE